MSLPKSSQFNFLDRGNEQTVVLIPGWATDHRIFTHLDLAANYLVMTSCLPNDFDSALINALDEHNIRRASYLGVSLGGFMAARFAAHHPARIQELILVSIREQYPAVDIEQVARYLVKNKKAYLSKFYSQCFNDECAMGVFERGLFDEYCNTFELDFLLETLQYLKEARIEDATLAGLAHVKIIHGASDRIAPCIEAYELSTRLYNADFMCLPGVGHFPFLAPGFSQMI
ncbi:MAG: alpha/beta fold hydrolase [Candidatus Omnitrophota bacterium]